MLLRVFLLSLLITCVASEADPESVELDLAADAVKTPIEDMQSGDTNLPSDGYHERSFGTGAAYRGEWYNFKKHGTGEYIFANGDVYYGTFQFDVQHGEGELVYKDGASFTGSYHQGKKEGPGKAVYADGTEYDGDWKNGKRHGEGTGTFKEGASYKGGWIDGTQHGNGRYSFPNGDVYDGEWKEGQKHGHATYTLASGDIHEGIWEGGEFKREILYRGIKDATKVLGTINLGTKLANWPSEEIKAVAGKNGWGDWKPETGMVGKVLKSWGKKTNLLSKHLMKFEFGAIGSRWVRYCIFVEMGLGESKTIAQITADSGMHPGGGEEGDMPPGEGEHPDFMYDDTDGGEEMALEDEELPPDELISEEIVTVDDTGKQINRRSVGETGVTKDAGADEMSDEL